MMKKAKDLDKEKDLDEEETKDLSDEELNTLLEEIERDPPDLPNIDPELSRIYRIYGESIPEGGE
jgi:hypothetical protein